MGITAFPRFGCFSPALLGVGAAARFSWWFPNKQPTSWLSVIRVAGGCSHLCGSLPVLTTLFVLPISLGRSPLIFSVQHIWEKHIFLSYRNGLLCFLRLKRKAFLDPNTDLKNHLNSSYIAGERAILVVMGGTFFFFLIYLFMAVLGLRFCARAFSSCSKRWPLFIAVRGPLTIAASLVEHRLQTRRLSNCGSRAQLLRSMWDLPRPGLEPASPALAGRLSTTAPPGKPGWYILSHSVHSKYFVCVYVCESERENLNYFPSTCPTLIVLNSLGICRYWLRCAGF